MKISRDALEIVALFAFLVGIFVGAGLIWWAMFFLAVVGGEAEVGGGIVGNFAHCAWDNCPTPERVNFNAFTDEAGLQHIDG